MVGPRRGTNVSYRRVIVRRIVSSVAPKAKCDKRDATCRVHGYAVGKRERPTSGRPVSAAPIQTSAVRQPTTRRDLRRPRCGRAVDRSDGGAEHVMEDRPERPLTALAERCACRELGQIRGGFLSGRLIRDRAVGIVRLCIEAAMLLAPPQVLTAEARRRQQVVEQHHRRRSDRATNRAGGCAAPDTRRPVLPIVHPASTPGRRRSMARARRQPIQPIQQVRDEVLSMLAAR